jgi:hypothetical protein
MWGFNVRARNPDVVGTVPTVIAGLPDPAGVGRYRDDLDRTRRRRADANDDLCVSRGGREGDAKGCGEKWLLEFHEVISFLLVRSDASSSEKVVVVFPWFVGTGSQLGKHYVFVGG